MDAHRLHYHYATTGNVNMSMAKGKGVNNPSNREGGSKAAMKADYKEVPEVNSQGLKSRK